MQALANRSHGHVITAENADYDKAGQALFNRAAHPAGAGECADESDVAATVDFAVKHDIRNIRA